MWCVVDDWWRHTDWEQLRRWTNPREPNRSEAKTTRRYRRRQSEGAVENVEDNERLTIVATSLLVVIISGNIFSSRSRSGGNSSLMRIRATTIANNKRIRRGQSATKVQIWSNDIKAVRLRWCVDSWALAVIYYERGQSCKRRTRRRRRRQWRERRLHFSIRRDEAYEKRARMQTRTVSEQALCSNPWASLKWENIVDQAIDDDPIQSVDGTMTGREGR